MVPAGLGAGQLDHFYLVSSSTFLYLLTAPFAILLVSTVSRGGSGGGGGCTYMQFVLIARMQVAAQ